MEVDGLVGWLGCQLINPNPGDQIKNEMGWACGKNWEKKDVYRASVGSHEGKRPLGRPSCRWEDSIKMHLQEIGYGRGLN